MINPIFTSDKISNMIDNVLNSSLSDIIGTDFVSSSPSVNIVENEKQHTIRVAAPGLDKKDFIIQVEKDQLLISIDKTLANENSDSSFLRREFSYSSFKRSFHLPETIDKENISATYVDGILSIIVAKNDIDKDHKRKMIDIV